MICRRCGFEHPTELEALACEEVFGGRGAEQTRHRRQRLAEANDEAWEAAVDVARARWVRRRRHERAGRR